MLPRKSTAMARHRASLESAAFQVGVIVAVERNRQRLTQTDLATRVGVDQIDISNIENGQRADISDARIDAVFKALGPPNGTAHANYVKWWRDNSTL